jgi:hypothetical protein
MTITPGATVAGHRVSRSLGLVYGDTIRARHVGRDILAALKNVIGGEIEELCLLKGPFLLPSLMLRPIVDTLLGDDLRSSLAPADRPRTGPVARRAAP